MDWKQILEIVSPVTIIFAAGMLYQEIRTFRTELRDLRSIREDWKSVLTRIGSLESFQSKLASDHKELRGRLDETRDELHSIHD